jgi:hypothetical protein
MPAFQAFPVYAGCPSEYNSLRANRAGRLVTVLSTRLPIHEPEESVMAKATISDIDLYDEISKTTDRIRALFYAIMGLPNIGSQIGHAQLDPLGAIGMDEADKIEALIEKWHQQNRRSS